MKKLPGIKTFISKKDDIEIIKRDPRLICNWDTFLPYRCMNIYSKTTQPVQEILKILGIDFEEENPMTLNYNYSASECEPNGSYSLKSY